MGARAPRSEDFLVNPKHDSEVQWATPVQTHIKLVTTSVKARVGDDITESQDDDANVRNCRSLHIFIVLEFLVQIPWKGALKSGKSSV